MPYDNDPISTAALVALAQGGDSEALARLLRESYPRLLRTAAQLLRDDDLAQDVVQETLLKIVRRIDQLDEPAAYPGWARTILRRETQEYFRRGYRSPVAGIEYDDNRLELQQAPPQRPFETSEDMDHCLRTLRSEDRRVLALHYWGGLEVREISAALGIAVGAVKTRLFRARNRLRDRLAEIDSILVPQS